MKTLLIYKSETGFTKAYADMIKARIPDLTVVDLKHFKRISFTKFFCLYF